MTICRMDFNLQKVALRVDQHLALAPGDFLPAIVAARTTGFGGLDRLAVNDGGRWLRFTSVGDAIALPQDLCNSLPQARLAPFAQVIIDRLPRGKIVRHPPPRDPAAQDI